jgi:hypothetical protein
LIIRRVAIPLMTRGQTLVSKDKGESFDEICTDVTVNMVIERFINEYMFYITGSICVLDLPCGGDSYEKLFTERRICGG